MRFRSIGFKLTFWYSGLLSLTFLLLAVTAYGLLSYSLSRQMDNSLNSIGEVLVEKTREEGAGLYPADVDELFRRFFGFSPLERYFDIFAPDNRPGQDPKQEQAKQNPISPEAIEYARRGESYLETISDIEPYPVRVLTAPVMVGGRLTNVVRVGMSLENIYKTRRQFILIMAAIFPLGLILAGGGGWLLARRALSPVDQMTRTARKISGEDLDQRLEETGNGDELDRLASTLNQMLDRLHQSIEQMRRFSADASHELQTPLTILKGEMEVALRRTRSLGEYQEVLSSGLEEIDRLNHLVEGLLLLARADGGVLQLDAQPLELPSFLIDIFNQMEPLAQDYRVSLQMETSDPVTIEADGEHLRRLFYNLLSNAIKYSPAESQVKVSISRRQNRAVINIVDQGRGIPEEEQTQIFDRFYRATSTGSRDREGVGLGLSISASIVKAHGGRIEVESVPGDGSTFKVFLPC